MLPQRAPSVESELYQLVSLFQFELMEAFRAVIGRGEETFPTEVKPFATSWTVKEIIRQSHERLDDLYHRFSGCVGRRAADGCFEHTFIQFFDAHRNAPTIFELLSCLPDHLRTNARAERLRELESIADRAAKDLARTNVALEQKTRELSDRVDELRRANETMKRNDQARGDFVRVVSHQFRTPLSAIRWEVDALEETLQRLKAPKESLEACGEIRYEAKFLITALEKIFDALAIETGTLAIVKKPVFFWEIVQDEIEDARAQIKAKKLVVSFQKSHDALVQIPLDKARIKSMVAILLENAINYSRPEGTIAISLSVSGEGEARQAKLAVRDEGIGVKTIELDQLFEKFFRGSGAVKAVPNGTGLGLYIVKHFVEMHGGSVAIVSKENQGFEVTVALPVNDL